MFVHLGLLLGFILDKFTRTQFVPFSPKVQFFMESNELVASYDDAKRTCGEKNSFLAVLDSPELMNFVYETLRKKTNKSKKKLFAAA